MQEAPGALLLRAVEHIGRQALLDDEAFVHEDRRRSPTSRANCISCVTTSIVMPSRARSRITISTSPTSSGSSADVTSSKSITCGFIISARAIATRCC